MSKVFGCETVRPPGHDGDRPVAADCLDHSEEGDGDERGTDPGGELDEGL